MLEDFEDEFHHDQKERVEREEVIVRQLTDHEQVINMIFAFNLYLIG